MYQRELEANFGGLSQHKLQSLLENEEFMLTFSFVSLAKNFNFFGELDNYLKELARISLALPNKAIQQRLESILSKEIAIPEVESVVEGAHLPY